MKRLADKVYLKHTGCYYRMIGRSKQWAIYSQHRSAEDSTPIAYEVFKIRLQKESNPVIGGEVVHFNATEKFPRNSEWGRNAWTFMSKQRAMDVFLENSKHELKPTEFETG